ncbi:unnamed protein product [Leuciscus chuanchicus]
MLSPLWYLMYVFDGFTSSELRPHPEQLSIGHRDLTSDALLLEPTCPSCQDLYIPVWSALLGSGLGFLRWPLPHQADNLFSLPGPPG